MADLKWKYTPDEINHLRRNSISKELNEIIESWWEAWDNAENTTQEEIDELESTITRMM